MTFQDLGLLPPIQRAVREAGYTQPTPIQRDAIPPVLEGRDLVGCAQTGTGKTAAFALPMLQLLDARAGEEPSLKALILTPTRELAAQINDSFATYGKHLELWHTVIFGGVKDRPQIEELRQGVDILVATPGRLLDLMGRGEVSLEQLEIFVLDEADRMLDMGFLPDVKRVVAKLPTRRQTLFFSATMPEEIRALAESLARDPVRVAVARISAPADHVSHRLYFVDKADKRRLLLHLLQDQQLERTLVFSRTKHGANRIAKVLDRAGIRCAALHGNKSQNARTRALEGFRNGELPVLVATDIAARGIDVERISHVINFDLPNEPEVYVHRIGRTARAGASGVALSFCDQEERAYLVDIERLMQQHLERVEQHPYPASQPPPPQTVLKPTRRSEARGASGRARPAGRAGAGRRPRSGRRGSRRGARRPQS